MTMKETKAKKDNENKCFAQIEGKVFVPFAGCRLISYQFSVPDHTHSERVHDHLSR